MVLHQHHCLAEAFPLKGIHLKESYRSSLKNLAEFIERFKSNGCTISSSFHDPEKINSEASAFDYVFLSPVFTSFSKRGYKGQTFNVEKLTHKMIALGGIEADKIEESKALGYSGIAVLGAVWLAENRNKAFTEVYKEYSNVYQ